MQTSQCLLDLVCLTCRAPPRWWQRTAHWWCSPPRGRQKVERSVGQMGAWGMKRLCIIAIRVLLRTNMEKKRKMLGLSINGSYRDRAETEDKCGHYVRERRPLWRMFVKEGVEHSLRENSSSSSLLFPCLLVTVDKQKCPYKKRRIQSNIVHITHHPTWSLSTWCFLTWCRFEELSMKTGTSLSSLFPQHFCTRQTCPNMPWFGLLLPDCWG